MSDNTPKSFPPVFLKHSALTPPPNGIIRGVDLCYAIEKTTGEGTLDCLQRKGDLYRISLLSQPARNELLIQGFIFNSCNVTVLAHNPFEISDQGNPSTKIIIGGVPISVANSEFERSLIDQGVKIKSELKMETYRDADGKWTRFKTGRRFVYCAIPDLNLPTTIKIGYWRASIWYKEQIRPKKVDGVSKETPPSPTQQSPAAVWRYKPTLYKLGHM